MAGIRRDIASLGAKWSTELEWYAKAVRELQLRGVDDRTSWAYLGAIHGFDLGLWRELGILKPGDALPPRSEQEWMWNQCQHQGWYFLPWHRGYLWSFETIVSSTIEQLGGPSGWTLPYWNYFDASNVQARAIPPAFLDPLMPDGSPNPLQQIPRSSATELGPVPWFPQDIDLDAMQVPFYTSAPRARGFGGGVTLFNQFGGQTGALEGDPHNPVHVIVGGSDGYMANPNLAGLDPLFWLHHCNIDRLWSAWLATDGNQQENGPEWRNGPAARRFAMPDASGQLREFEPSQTIQGGTYEPNYDDLVSGTGGAAMPAGLEDSVTARFSADPPPPATLVGANAERLEVGRDPVATIVTLDAQEAQTASADEQQRVFLNLEQVRGTTPSGVLTVRIRPQQQGTAPASDAIAVKSVALFGLAKASDSAGGHGGNGISIAVDVTHALKNLGQAAGTQIEQLEIDLFQPGIDGRERPISVERVSLYRQMAS